MRGHVRSEIPRYKPDVQREGNNWPRVPGWRQLNLTDLVGGVLGMRPCDSQDHVGGVWRQQREVAVGHEHEYKT